MIIERQNVQQILMNIIDFLYYNVYRWYNNMKISGRNIDPLNMTSTAFGLCFCGWTLVGTWVYYHLTQKDWPAEGWMISVLAGFLGSYIIDTVYNSTKERYLKVYNYYSSFSQKRKSPIIFSLLFITLPFLILVLCAIIYKGY